MIFQTENLWFYLLAALVGSVFGWIFRGSCKQRVQLAEEQFNERYTKLKVHCKQYKSKIVRLNKKNAEQSSRLENQSSLSSVEQKKQIITPLEKRLSESGQLVKKLREFVERQQKELLNYKKIMRQAKQVIGQDKQEIEQLQLQIKAGEKRTLDLQKSYDSAQRSLSKGQSVTMSSQLKIAELMTDLTHYKKQLAEAQDALSIQEKEAKTAVPSDEEIVVRQKLQQQFDQSEQLVAEQKEKIERLEKSFQQAIDDKQDIASKLDEFKEQSSLYLSTAMEESRRYRQGVEFLQKELDKCKQELSTIPAPDINLMPRLDKIEHAEVYDTDVEDSSALLADDDHLSEPTPKGDSKSKSNLMPRLDKIEHTEVYDTDVEGPSVLLADDDHLSEPMSEGVSKSKSNLMPRLDKIEHAEVYDTDAEGSSVLSVDDHLSEPMSKGVSKSKSNLMPRLDKIEHTEVYDTDAEGSSVLLADDDYLSELTSKGSSKSKSNLMPRLDKIEHTEVYDTDAEDSSAFLVDDEFKTMTPEKRQSKIRQRLHMNKLLRRKRRR